MGDDAELLRRYAEDRSEAAFTSLVERHFDLVYSAARRQLQGDHHRAREVAQTVFIAAARKARSLVHHPALVGWLYTSTLFAAQKMIRDEQRRQTRESLAYQVNEGSPSEAAVDWERMRVHLDAAMLVLGSRERAAILLRFFEQKPFTEVGAELGVSENAARMRVERALAKLRRSLARQGAASSVTALAAALAGNASVAAPAGLSAAVASGALVELSTAAVAGTGAATTAVYLMANKLIFGAVAGCAALALGSGVYLSNQVRASERTALALERECAQLDQGLQKLSALRAAAPAPSALVGAPNRQRPVTTAATGAAAGPSADVLYREIAENPQLRRALGLNFLAMFKLKYGPLAQTMGWAESQLNQLAELDLKLRSDVFDLTQAARLQGIDPGSDPNLAALEQRIMNQQAEAVQNLIGTQGVQQMQEYNRVYDARDLAKQVAAGTYFSAAPLTSAQADQLTQILVDSDAGAAMGGSTDSDAIDWDRALTQAAAVLPAPQLAALRSLRAARDLHQLEGQEGETP